MHGEAFHVHIGTGDSLTESDVQWLRIVACKLASYQIVLCNYSVVPNLSLVYHCLLCNPDFHEKGEITLCKLVVHIHFHTLSMYILDSKLLQALEL